MCKWKSRRDRLAVRCDIWVLMTDPACQGHVFYHEGDALGMQTDQEGIFEQSDDVGFSCFLKGKNSRGLEPWFTNGHVSVNTQNLRRDLPHKAKERALAQEQVGGLLVAPNQFQGILMCPSLASFGRWSPLTRRLSSWAFAMSLNWNLFGACHVESRKVRSR